MNKFFISPGDPAGVGPEITLKALSNNKDLQNNFVLAGDITFYQDLIRSYNLDLKFDRRRLSGERRDIQTFSS